MPFPDASGTKQPTRNEQTRIAAEAARPAFPSHQFGRGARPERGPQDGAPTNSGVKRNLGEDDAASALQERNLFGLNAPAPRTPTDMRPAEQLPTEESPPGLLNSAPLEEPEQALEEELESPDLIASEEGEPANEEASIQSLSDLATALEVDLDDLLNVEAATKIDGQVGRVKLGELLSSYQQQGHITRTQQALSEERTKLNTEHTSRMSAVDKTHADATALLEVAKEFILGEYKGINWEKEFAEDPAAAGPRYFAFQQRIAAFNDAVAKQAIAHGERTQQRNVSQAEYAQQELRALYNAVPQWADHKVATADKTRIEKYALDLGFTPQEIGTVLDHRQIRVLHDAARYAELKGVRAPTLNKGVKPAAPTARVGARAAQGLSSVNLSKAKARLKATGDVHDAAILLDARLSARGRKGR